MNPLFKLSFLPWLLERRFLESKALTLTGEHAWGIFFTLCVTPYGSICSTELLIPHTSGNFKGCKLDGINDVILVTVYGSAFPKFAINSKGLKIDDFFPL